MSKYLPRIKGKQTNIQRWTFSLWCWPSISHGYPHYHALTIVPQGQYFHYRPFGETWHLKRSFCLNCLVACISTLRASTRVLRHSTHGLPRRTRTVFVSSKAAAVTSFKPSLVSGKVQFHVIIILYSIRVTDVYILPLVIILHSFLTQTTARLTKGCSFFSSKKYDRINKVNDFLYFIHAFNRATVGLIFSLSLPPYHPLSLFPRRPRWHPR